MYSVITTPRARKALNRLPANWQDRIIAKLEAVARDPYAPNNNVTRLQGREGFRLRVGDWRVIYVLEDDRLVMLVVEVGPRGGVY